MSNEKTCALCGGIIRIKQGFLKASTQTATRYLHCMTQDCREHAELELSDRCIMRLGLKSKEPEKPPRKNLALFLGWLSSLIHQGVHPK